MGQVQLDEADEFLLSLGLSTGETSPEDRFWDSFTEGGAPKLDMLKYWLNHELYKYYFILQNNIKITKDTVKDGVLQARILPKLDYAKLHIQYYLQMHHLSWFMKIADDREPCNMQIVIDKILLHPLIRTLIEKDHTK